MTKSTRLLLLICLFGTAAFIVYPVPMADKLAAVAYGLDPQRPSHTYSMGDRLLPLEARKTGMFGGFFVTLAYLLARGRLRATGFPTKPITILLLVFVALMGLDGLNATFYDLGWPHLYLPSLRLRLASGLLMGLAMAAFLLPAVGGLLWRNTVNLSSLSHSKDVLFMLLLMLAFFSLIDAQLRIMYYPLAFMSITGLLAVLVMINMVFVLAASGRIGLADTLIDVLPPALIGFVLAVCELAIMSVIRYLTLGNITDYM